MNLIVTLVGVLVVAAAVLIAVAPMRLIDWIRSLESRKRFRTAILVRAALGVAFLVAAPTCRQPVVVQVVGIIMLLAAAGLLVLGRERLDSFMAWWMAQPESFLRIWSIAALGFGVLLIYSGA